MTLTWPFKVTQGQKWWGHWTLHIWFPIHGPLSRGDFFQNRITSSLGPREASHQKWSWLVIYFLSYVVNRQTHGWTDRQTDTQSDCKKPLAGFNYIGYCWPSSVQCHFEAINTIVPELVWTFVQCFQLWYYCCQAECQGPQNSLFLNGISWKYLIKYRSKTFLFKQNIKRWHFKFQGVFYGW